MLRRNATVYRLMVLVCTMICNVREITADADLLEGDTWCMRCSPNVSCDNVVWMNFKKPRTTSTCENNQPSRCISDLRLTDTRRYACRRKHHNQTVAVENIKVFTKDAQPYYVPSISVKRYRHVHDLRIRLKYVSPFFALNWTLPAHSTAQKENRLHLGVGAHTLRIVNAGATDAGDYRCLLTNPVNSQSSEAIFRDISVSEEVGPVMPDVHAAPGQMVNMTCDVRAMTHEDVVWSFSPSNASTIDQRLNWDYLSDRYNHTTTTPDGRQNRIYNSRTDPQMLWIQVYEPYLIAFQMVDADTKRIWIAMADVHIVDVLITQHPAQMFAGNASLVRCSAPIRQIANTVRVYQNDAEVAANETSGVLVTSEAVGDVYVTTVTFERIRLEDAGRYTCSAVAKGSHQRVEQAAEVLVFDGPMIARRTESETIDVDLGQPLTLDCTVTGYPMPTVEWFFHDKSVSDDVDIRIFKQTLLKIEPVARKHIGAYQCVASNEFGRSTHQFIVRPRTAFGFYESMWITSTVLSSLLLLGTALWFYRREYLKRVQLQHAGIAYFIKGNASGRNEEISIVDQADLLPYDTAYDFPKKNLTLGGRLGAGAFGDVYRGDALGLNRDEYSTPVAVKCVRNPDSNADIKSLIGELKIMIHYGRHLNVLQLLGVVRENLNQRELLVITELCPFGSIHDFLRNNRKQFRDIPLTERTDDGVCPTDLVYWSYQVAQGMNYLANQGILHGDLAARNVLLTHDNMIRICDFGFSRRLHIDDDYHKETNVALPLKWMAIESIAAKTFNASTDVWSFGVTMWELFSLGDRPYADVDIGDLLTTLQSGYRLAKPTFAQPELYDLMLDCWAAVSAERPRFGVIGRRLEELLPGPIVQEFHVRVADYESRNLYERRRTMYDRPAEPEAALESIAMAVVSVNA